MKPACAVKSTPEILPERSASSTRLDALVALSWAKIAPSWPLKNLIAVNPLAGFENAPFEDALREAQACFQSPDLPAPMQAVNRESIKWLQAFFDDGQATLPMPLRRGGLYKSVKALLPYDKKSAPRDERGAALLHNLPEEPEAAIAECLLYFGIRTERQGAFLTLMLTTLPGWAAYIKYRTEWADAADLAHPHPVTQADYLALRLVLTCLLWPQAESLLPWHQARLDEANVDARLRDIEAGEQAYRESLLNVLASPQDEKEKEKAKPRAQLVFCIDVRSEPFRRALEAQGAYETFGFAGFFGVPVSVRDDVTGEAHAACPVLLKPAHTVPLRPVQAGKAQRRTQARRKAGKRLYQSLKYTFTAPFLLVEALGPFSGLRMALRNWAPGAFAGAAGSRPAMRPDLAAIPAERQVHYAAEALRLMGLTRHFAPLVVLCGHGAETQNNAYASALDCGACGGHHGAPNARILATMLNDKGVRRWRKRGSPFRTKRISSPPGTTRPRTRSNWTTRRCPKSTRKGCAICAATSIKPAKTTPPAASPKWRTRRKAQKPRAAPRGGLRTGRRSGPNGGSRATPPLLSAHALSLKMSTWRGAVSFIPTIMRRMRTATR